MYQVSNQGRLRSLDRLRYRGRGTHAKVRGKVLKPQHDKEGYIIAKLCKHAKYTYPKMHRLVAQMFIGESPGKGYQVNHLDGDKANNAVDNLEWVTQSENMKHAYRTGLVVHWTKKAKGAA